MSESLLAHLYTHIRGSQEDIATLSLQYILSGSDALNNAFCDLISHSIHKTIGRIRFVCQATGENRERPDIAGYNDEGQEVILCEAKFYAGLTDNQPISYIDRLAKEGGMGLVFICPEARKTSLWSILLDRCKEKSLSIYENYYASVDGTILAIITWRQIIEILRLTASAHAVSSLSDIEQLDGFCKRMDSDAFIPFITEEFGTIEARKAERYYQVLDGVVDKLKANKSLEISLKGLRATPFRYGYCRYFQLNGITVSFHYNRKMWARATTAETPFWICFTDNWNDTDKILKAFRTIPEINRETDDNDGHLFLPLFAKPHATLDEVTSDMAKQILAYYCMID